MAIPKPDIPAGPLAPDAIRVAVRGRDPKISQTTALYLLSRRSDILNRHLDFQAVLEDAHAPTGARCAAAMHLGDIATPESRKILERNLGIEDKIVRGRVMRSLAVIGDASLLPRFAEIREQSRGWHVEEATWAARLLAHRFSVRGQEVPAPRAFLEIDTRATRDLAIREADDQDKSALKKSFDRQPLGMTVDWSLVSRLQCGRRTMFLLLNQPALESWRAERGLESCLLLGSIVHRQDAEVHTALYYLLTCPSEAGNKAALSLWTARGRLVYAGEAMRQRSAVEFDIRGIDDFGVVAIDVAGTWTDGRIELVRKRVGIGVAKRRLLAIDQIDPASPPVD